MNLYYNTTFQGKWPVPTAAIVWAEDEKAAARILNSELKRQNIIQPIKLKAKDMQIFPQVEKIAILSDGDY